MPWRLSCSARRWRCCFYIGDYYHAYQLALETLRHPAYGTEDRTLKLEKCAEDRARLPEGFAEIRIEGGCRVCFGSFGKASHRDPANFDKIFGGFSFLLS